MSTTELLTVEERFQIESRGLVLLPDFPVPEGGWQTTTQDATILRPDGARLRAQAQLSLSRSAIRDSAAPTDRRWRVAITLLRTSKEDVPIGSRLFVPPRIAARLLPCMEQGEA